MTLREVFHHAKEHTLPSGWLCLPIEGEWSLETEGEVLDGDDLPAIAKRNGLRETLDNDTIEEIVGWDRVEIRSFLESYGFVIQEWDKVSTDLLTIRDSSAVVLANTQAEGVSA